MLPYVKDAAFWQKIRKNEAYAPMINEVYKAYETNKDPSLPALRYSEWSLFYKTGDRATFETPYFRRRHWLSAAAILALLYPEEPQYITEVQDLLWAICDEYCWSFPAHTTGNLQEDLTNIDLFAAETGFMITELCECLESRLEPAVLIRAREVVRQRIIENLALDRHYWWDDCTSNWAAVCAGSVGAVLLYLEPNYEKMMPRIYEAMDKYLEGFLDDGVCIEGPTYWNYGFGYYVRFADLLYRATNGEKDLLASEKVRRIANYLPATLLPGNTMTSFSDSNRTPLSSLGIHYYLQTRFPKEGMPFPVKYMQAGGFNLNFVSYLRSFIYFDPSLPEAEYPTEDHFFPYAQHAALRRKAFALAAKAGHNDEPHNHNDVGSFILADKNGQVLCDLGCGLYTREYFKWPDRYYILCNNSFGHSVPIVDGNAQMTGEQYCGTMTYENGAITIEMAKAYGNDALQSLTRHFTAEEDAVCLCDNVVGDVTLTERFVSLIKPRVEANVVYVGDWSIRSSEAWPITITEEQHLCHAAVSENEDLPNNSHTFEPVYCIDFAIPPETKNIQFVFKKEQ